MFLNSKIFRSNLFLALFVIVIFFLNFYTKTLFFRPNSVHQWRQADCLSITKNYYEEGMHFFQPKIHYQGPPEGKAVSEFPIMNYTVACLWKIFGEHEFIYRLLEYFIFLLGIFVLFNTLLRFYGSALLAFFSVSLVLTSPLIAYYSLNFIVDVPAFSIGVIAFCYVFRFYVSRNMKYFYIALFTGALAVLMKASALMAFGLLLFFCLIDILRLNRFFRTEQLFKNRIVPLISLLLAVGIIFGWYRFALHYNEDDTNNIFLLTVLPIWELDERELIYNLKFLFNNHFPVFLNKPMFFLFMSLVLFVAAKFRALNSFLKYAFVFTAVFFVFYLLFFFKVFSVHDYYLNNLMIFPVVTCFCFLHIISGTDFLARNKGFLWLFVSVVVTFNTFHSAAVYRLRTVEDDKLIHWFPFISEDEQKLFKYLAWDYGNAIKHVEDITPALRAHGIKREDWVLSIPDQSFDISLYFMDQKGFCISKEHFMLDTLVADQFLHKKIKYMVMSDTTLKQQRTFKRIEKYLEPVFTRNYVEVFRFKPGM